MFGIGALALQLLTTSARAELETVEGYIVAIEGEDLIIDLPPESGVKVGSEVGVWRKLTLRHPVTGESITDRYRFGVLLITQVMTNTSMSRAKGKLEREPVAGDLVRYSFEVAAPADAASSAEGPLASERSATAVGEGTGEPGTEADQIAQLLAALRGQTPSARAAAYESYVQAHPKTAYRQVLLEEAGLLKRRRNQEPASKECLTVETREPENRAYLELPRVVEAELGLHLTLQLARPARGVLLHHRKDDDAAFETLHLTAQGDLYYTGRLSPDELEGRVLQFFVEVVGSDGKAAPVLGTEKRPMRTAVVREPQVRKPLEHQTTLQVVTDYADFNRLRGNDTAWQTEGALRLRFGHTGLRALSTGFGVYRGKGGSVEALDARGEEPKSVGLTYGTVGAELAPNEKLGFIAIGTVGLGDEGVRGGIQGLLRIGSDLDTNLTLGGELLGGIGVRGIAQFEMQPLSRFPVLIRSEVTNQPAGNLSSSEAATVSPTPELPQPGALQTETNRSGDVGVRGIVQLGYRITDGFVLSARASYQGRNVKHSGPGFGGGVSYTW